MNFSEILNKKKKNKMEVNQNPENTEQNEMLHENETGKNEVSEGIDEGSEESSSENTESQISEDR
jgi:hypothetical protein